MSVLLNQQFRDVFVAAFAPDLATAATSLVNNMLDRTVSFRTGTGVLDASTNTAGTYTLDQSTSLPLTVKTFKVIVYANVTADDTNNATFALVYNNGNGGSDTTIASGNHATTGSGGLGTLTSAIATSISINSTNQVIPAGSQVQIKITKAGAGGSPLPVTDFTVTASLL